MPDPVRVPLDMECPCPGHPHEREWVELAPKLGVVAGAAAMAAVRSAAPTPASQQAALTSAWLMNITGWSFTGEPDKDGTRHPVAVTPENTERLLDWASASGVADKADELYSEDFLRPLAKRLSASSSAGPTEPSTSAPTSSGPTPPRRSRPSSPASSGAGKPSGDPAP